MGECRHCRKFFARYTCGKLRGFDECDCPKCQGYCECDEPDPRDSDAMGPMC